MTIQQNEIKILDQLLLVDLSGIHLWTARKKLKPEMLEGKIPPASLASLGSMRVIDPEKLKPFEKIKRQATKAVEENGVKFLGGFAVARENIQKVVDRLEALKTQFYDEKNLFIPNYDTYISQWISKGWEKQEWQDAIRASITPKSQVEAGLQFGYAACRVAPDGDSHLSDTLGGEVRGLSDQLYAETAETAERLLETGLATRGHVTQTTLNTVRKMNTKLKGLMFLSSDVKALSSHIEDTLAALPVSGVVNGGQYNTVVALISALSDESSIKRLIKHLNIANEQGSRFDPLADTTPESIAPVAVVESEVEVQEKKLPQAPSAEVVDTDPEDAELVTKEDLAVDDPMAKPFVFRPEEVEPAPETEADTTEVVEVLVTQTQEPEPKEVTTNFWF